MSIILSNFIKNKRKYLNEMRYNTKINIIFIFFLFFFIILLGVFGWLISTKPKWYILPKTKRVQSSIRGSILTKNYVIVNSCKNYIVTINPSFIDKNKLDLFVNLFAIYSNVDKSLLKKRILNKLNEIRNNKAKSYSVLLAKVDFKTAMNLKYLLHVLDRKRVFLTDKNGYRRGYSISDATFDRLYPFDDTLEPVLGRYRYDMKRGENGIEEYYDSFLQGKQKGMIVGERDVLGNIIYNNNVKIIQPINGKNLKLNINLILQRRIEKLLDIQKEKFKADEVMAVVMDSKTGKILAIASSNRYIPNYITKKDIPNMKISFIRSLFEPGSVMKPITFAILLKHNKVKPKEVLKAFHGRWKPEWRKTSIIDDIPFDFLSAKNAIVYSSNIVISQLALRLSNKEFFQGLKNFGFGEYTGIDLPYELKGYIPSLKKLKYSVFKSTTSYGYGIFVNLIQLVKAYNVFNNEGIEVIPKIADVKSKSLRLMSKKNAKIMLNILRDVVLKGTAKKAFIKGVFTAGKTGTAQVSINGQYKNIYNSSFIGFTNDKKHKYTIGVTLLRIKAKWPDYFASNSAVPTFKKIVDIMIQENLLKEINETKLFSSNY